MMSSDVGQLDRLYEPSAEIPLAIGIAQNDNPIGI